MSFDHTDKHKKVHKTLKNRRKPEYFLDNSNCITTCTTAQYITRDAKLNRQRKSRSDRLVQSVAIGRGFTILIRFWYKIRNEISYVFNYTTE